VIFPIGGRRDTPLRDAGDDVSTMARKRIVRIAVAAGTIGAFWFAAAAPFFQGPVAHW